MLKHKYVKSGRIHTIMNIFFVIIIQNVIGNDVNYYYCIGELIINGMLTPHQKYIHKSALENILIIR